MNQLTNDQVLACLDELRAAVKLLSHGGSSDSAYEALDLGLAVCAGIAQQRLSLPLIHKFIHLLCAALEADGVELEIGLALPAPPRLLCA